ncbi:MAG TPA: Gfo/Idh/MocA family oxidoreductase [Microvirga sp.]|jgi:predicted dehydrogenase|nr:Gfo/Idh/MocA family oxidoreductase [Microvirga sp.]
MTRKRRIAIVGLGMAHKPHLASLRDLSDRVEIAACYTPSEERRQAFAKANPDLNVTHELETSLADPNLDGVILLTPPTTHLDLVQRCAAAGKHVLLEKPIEVSVERARRCVEAMDQAGLRLAVVFQHRFRAAARKLRELVDSGELGALVSGSAAIRWWRSPEYFAQAGRGMKARDGGGVLLTQAIHTLDLFQSLTGPVAQVAAMAATSPLRAIDTEDVAAAAVRFDNGAIGTIDATTVSYPGQPERIELACEKGTAILLAEGLEVHWKDGRHFRHEGSAAGGGGVDPMAFSHEAHKALIADFLDAIDEGRDPLTTGREAIRVQVLIEAILQSAAEGRVVTVQRAW